jgi:FKBP-type peptidyl-prolyl cis-trans isomerase
VSGGLASLVACCTLATLFAAGREVGALPPARRAVGASCVLLVALVALAGCGGESSPRTDSGASATVERTTATVSAAAQARADARAQRRAQLELERTFAPNPWKEPGATAPHPGGRVKQLIVHDVKRGRGSPLTGDENVWVNYVKTYWKSGRVFLVAWGRLRANYFSLPAQPPGIRRGMIGMRPGGRRTIVMPEAIGDIHEPHHRGGWEAATVDIVLRNIIHLPTE